MTVQDTSDIAMPAREASAARAMHGIMGIMSWRGHLAP